MEALPLRAEESLQEGRIQVSIPVVTESYAIGLGLHDARLLALAELLAS